MLQTSNDNSDVSFTRCLSILMKLAILGALAYGGIQVYNTITKDTPKLGHNIGPARIHQIKNSLGDR